VGVATPAQAADAVAARKVTTLTEPVALATRSAEPATVFIAQQNGIVRRLHLLQGGGVSVDPTVVLDISGKVLDSGERGLLGMTFSPSGDKLYAYYTDANGNNNVVEFPYAAGRANAGAERLVLFLAHPTYGNHNGGNIAFGPDGLLYIGTGDGGGTGDPNGNAQNLDSLLGKILRINPSQPNATAQVFAYGLRNPWRWSFDRGATHDLWIGDVGQDIYEEVDRIASTRSGVNFGWNLREGKHPYNGGTKPAGAVDPVFEYSHANGNCSITGGYVYRGSLLRGRAGQYFFADFCKGDLRVRATGGGVSNLGVHIAGPSSFGQDLAGELWVLSLDGPVYRLVRRA
jgi:glucose/arabinose dehydrogenase